MMPSIMILDLFDNPGRRTLMDYLKSRTPVDSVALSPEEAACFIGAIMRCGKLILSLFPDTRRIIVANFVPNIRTLLVNPDFRLSLRLLMMEYSAIKIMKNIQGDEYDWKRGFKKSLGLFYPGMAARIYRYAILNFGDSIETPENHTLPSHEEIDRLLERQRKVLNKAQWIELAKRRN